MPFQEQVKQDLESVVQEFLQMEWLQEGQLLVIGCSTSEVIGKQIGTSGSEEVAKLIYNAMSNVQKQTGVHLVFQCCEHLNRALVMERRTMEKQGLEQVTVIPVREAGGSMATYAYHQMENPVVVENVQADAGIDIGETFIGMHLKSVAVPVRFTKHWIGEARLTAARTRPKLIGGARAVYPDK